MKTIINKIFYLEMLSYKNFLVIVLIAVVFITVQAMNQADTSAESSEKRNDLN